MQPNSKDFMSLGRESKLPIQQLYNLTNHWLWNWGLILTTSTAPQVQPSLQAAIFQLALHRWLRFTLGINLVGSRSNSATVVLYLSAKSWIKRDTAAIFN